MSQDFVHIPVMVDEVLAALATVPAGTMIDATLGGAGHAAAILRAYPSMRVVGIDQDEEAVAAARNALGEFGARASVHHGRFDQLREIARSEGLSSSGVSAVLFDLGVSSHQLDTPSRGFSYNSDGPLDMRMDTSRGITAEQFINGASEHQLSALFAANGESRFAKRIAHRIVERRPLHSTRELAELVAQAVPVAARRRGHPARRIFQALRVEVNAELDLLAPAIDAAVELLVPGGRIIVLSYHSGEDRITKNRLAFGATGGCVCPVGLPCVCGAIPTLRLLNRGARMVSAEEMARNPRAESARLRVAERLSPSEQVARS